MENNNYRAEMLWDVSKLRNQTEREKKGSLALSNIRKADLFAYVSMGNSTSRKTASVHTYYNLRKHNAAPTTHPVYSSDLGRCPILCWVGERFLGNEMMSTLRTWKQPHQDKGLGDIVLSSFWLLVIHRYTFTRHSPRRHLVIVIKLPSKIGQSLFIW